MASRLVTVSLLAALTLGLAGCGGTAGTAGAPETKGLTGPPPAELLAPGPLGEHVLGKATAPVTLIEYASLTCPHCRNYHQNIFPKVKRELIDTGKVRYIIREFPIGRSAGNAALVNFCAADGKWFPLFEAYLARQSEWVSQEVRLEEIFKVAQSSGMSRETFDKCLANQSIIDGLNEVKQRGRKFGVIGTPTFFANGRKAQGEVTFEEIKALIEPQSSS
jgi:protein-disulfide isomerase